MTSISKTPEARSLRPKVFLRHAAEISPVQQHWEFNQRESQAP
jgi:hypothetical protein